MLEVQERLTNFNCTSCRAGYDGAQRAGLLERSVSACHSDQAKASDDTFDLGLSPVAEIGAILH